MIELQQPLANELHYLGMGWLPPHQKQWAFCKKLLLEHIVFRESRLPPTELGLRDGTMVQCLHSIAIALFDNHFLIVIESFNLEELSYVLNVAGYGATKYEVRNAIVLI